MCYIAMLKKKKRINKKRKVLWIEWKAEKKNKKKNMIDGCKEIWYDFFF